MALFETTASALDLASGSNLSSEIRSAYSQSTGNIQNNRGAKVAWAKSKAEAVVSKRAFDSPFSVLECLSAFDILDLMILRF